MGISFTLFFFGLVFGSFAGAQVWRLRARQLKDDKKNGEEYDAREYAKLQNLQNRKQREDRSQCLHCGHRLAWYDLLPLVSWISMRGKCRYCKRAIGRFEPLIELGVALFFVISYLCWPFAFDGAIAIVQFGLWLSIGVLLTILFAYDAKWFLLPDRITLPTIAVALLYAVTVLLQGEFEPLSIVINLFGALTILSGLYLLLWFISKGAWIGFGDVKLGVILALLVVRWDLALLALFLANLIGCLIVIPGLVTKRMTRKTQVPFGPMLIMGTVAAVLFGDVIINWYISVTMTMLML